MKMTQREKLLITLLSAIVLLWLDYTYFIKAQWDLLEQTKANIVAYDVKLKELKEAPEKIKLYEEKLTELDSEIQSALSKQFTTTEQEELILLLTDLAENTGLEMTRIAFDPLMQVVSEDGMLYKSAVVINYTATYEALMTYLKKVWGFQKDIVVSALGISVSAVERIEGSFTLDFYFMVPPKGSSYKDNLFDFLIDESFFKINPFIVSTGANDFRINYLFTGGDSVDTEPYTPFEDIKGHWAEAEINAFGEQGFIKKGQSTAFKPDDAMSRGEFIILIDSIYQWPTATEPADLTQYSDYANLGSYENAISKAVVKGLLSGYVVGFEDNTLRPRDPITYSDVEYIMQRLKDDPTFAWNQVAAKLLEKKGILSAGATDKSAQMTKAEAVYLMTHFK